MYETRRTKVGMADVNLTISLMTLNMSASPWSVWPSWSGVIPQG